MQLAVLGKTAEGDTLREMCEHERGHLNKFNELVCSTPPNQNKSGACVPPTA